MKKNKKKLYVCVAVLLIVCISAPFAYAYRQAVAYAAVNKGADISRSNYDETISQAEKTKEEYEEKAASVQAEIDALSTEYDSIMNYIQELDRKQNSIYVQVDQISLKLAELEEEKAVVEAELEEATEKMNEQYEKMAARIKYVYENGETSYWEILVNSASLADLLNRVEYVSQISEYDDNLFTEYQEAAKVVSEYNDKLQIQLETIDNVQGTLDLCLEYADEIMAAKNAALDECAEKLGVSRELYDEYMVQIETQQMTIDQAKAAKAEEDRLAEIAAQQQQQQQSSVKGSGSSSVAGVTQTQETSIGSMIWPLPGYSRISSYFGYRTSPTAGASSNHKGIDIPASYGTPIVAALAGTVVASTYGTAQGNYIMIDHGNNNYTIYEHCSSFAVSTGTYVNQGQVIAYVGATGITTGAHLHFGVIIDGVYQNPLNYVAY